LREGVRGGEAAGEAARDSGAEADGHEKDGPLVVWNHRWEYDKNPTPFFRTLERLSEEGVAFHLALLGENPQYHPKEFEAARETLDPHIIRYGYLPDRTDYAALLRSADIVVSTSVQENFGISVVEAVAAGCIPLLPKRLSYPEIIPREYHDSCLYGSNRELQEKLRGFLTDGLPELPGLKEAMRAYDWSRLAPAYDRELEALAERRERNEAPD
jgi:glycosyltransferase involved in cell wall biosynthesis